MSFPDVFQAGKNRDGWFLADDLLAQVDHTMDISERLTGGYAQGLFLFDNVPSHQKHAENALSAQKMVKGVCFFIPQMHYPHSPPGPKDGWMHNNNSVRMHNGTLLTGETQFLYYPDDHQSMPSYFKGMEQILNLWPKGGCQLSA